MTALGVLAAALFGVFVLAVLKRYSPNIAVIAEAALVLFILFCVFKNFKEVFSEAEAILGETEISAGGIKIMLKIFGLLSAGALVSDICRDNSESALGSACDLFVRVLAAIAAMPVFISVIKVALEYLQNY